MQPAQQGMITIRTPFRISFFGGGTDFPEYFNEHGGIVIGTAVDKYIYVTINSLERFSDKRIRLSYSKLEYVNHYEELQHPIAKCILQNYAWDDHTFLDIHTHADLPISSGVGSSSSFSVGMLNALYLLNNLDKTPTEIAREAIFVEREQLQDIGGWQDQIFAAFGGFNQIRFSSNDFTVEPIFLTTEKKKALEKSCMIFFTGDTRLSAEVQKKVMGNPHPNKRYYLREIQKIADEALSVLHQVSDSDRLIREFGRLLDQTWQAKRALSPYVSNAKVDAIYEIAMQSGALGGKLCGAGGGGFLLFIVPEEKQLQVSNALTAYKKLNINFEAPGSRVIYSNLFIRGKVY